MPIEDTIETNAAQPKRVISDGTTVEQHGLPDQIAADKYLRAKTAAAKGIGLRLVKLVPGGQD
jgi:hypothetical protein